MSPSKTPAEILDVAGHEVRISSPDKVVFPEPGLTKLDLVRYYLAVADGALRGAGGRPMVLKRFVEGLIGRSRSSRSACRRATRLTSTRRRCTTRAGRRPRRRSSGMPRASPGSSNLGCLDLNPHAVRAEDLDHPDELRVDLDPMPGVDWSQIVDVAFVAREVLDDLGLVGWPKTSGSRGLHILVRIAPQWGVRATCGSPPRRSPARSRTARPGLATARWWKEERGESVFVDFNQNAKDRTVASAYSIRPLPDARVSTPLDWDEVRSAPPGGVHRADGAASGSPSVGDPHAGIDDAVGSLDALLALAERARPRREAAPRRATASGRRQSSQMPLIEVARTKTKPEAIEALEQWKDRASGVVAAPASRRRTRRRDARLEFALVPRAGQPAARPRGRRGPHRRS